MLNTTNILNRINPKTTPKWFKSIAFIAMVIGLACGSVVFGFDAGEIHVSKENYNSIKIIMYVCGAVSAVAMTAKNKE